MIMQRGGIVKFQTTGDVRKKIDNLTAISKVKKKELRELRAVIKGYERILADMEAGPDRPAP